jgi:hypothetical protein
MAKLKDAILGGEGAVICCVDRQAADAGDLPGEELKGSAPSQRSAEPHR